MDYYFEESVPVKYDSLFEEVARYAVTNGSISIADCHMHSISAHYISVHQKFINKQQPC